MAACIGKKLLSMIPLALIVSIILFGLINLLPGNAAMAILGDSGNLEQIEQLEAELGLDQPVYIQYINWLKGVCTCLLYTSLETQKSDVFLGLFAFNAQGYAPALRCEFDCVAEQIHQDLVDAQFVARTGQRKVFFKIDVERKMLLCGLLSEYG